jgi:hypothetical protein
MSAPLQGTASAALSIDRVKYTHDSMIDLIIANPAVKQGELAKHFGYTEPWVSRIMNSDAFLARLAERKKDVVDPQLVLSVEEKLRHMASRSLDIVMEKLEVTRNPDTALKALEISTKSLGYGARPDKVAIQQNFVVAMPQKAESAMEWAAKHAGGALSAGRGSSAEVVDVEIKSPALAELVERVQSEG